MTFYEAHPVAAVIIFATCCVGLIAWFHATCKICLPPGDSWTDFYKFVLKGEWLRRNKDA
jgi:hypothetical protein